MSEENEFLLKQAEDFRSEVRQLYALLDGITGRAWDRPTAFKGWTAIDIVGHLHMADMTAAVALEGPAAFAAHMEPFHTAVQCGEPATDYTRRWHGISIGQALVEQWRSFAEGLADHYRALDPRRRVYWGRGPDMSTRSCMSARQMEVWAHGQALFDLFGPAREEHDRILNIAVLGINTFGWTFRNRRLEVPAEPPFIQLTAPSGAVWQWNEEANENRVQGAAVEFCRVVTQTRNIADTGLSVDGKMAASWMAIAQCFAGPPHDPPRPLTRGPAID